MSFTNKIKYSISKSKDIMLVGEILVDEIIDISSKKTLKLFGGSPANIAMNIKKIGFDPLLVSGVGNDINGKFLLNELTVNNISTDLISITKFKTSVVKIDSSLTTPTPQFFRGSDYNINYSNSLKEIIKDVKILHFSYWPLSKEPSLSTIIKLIDDAKKNGVLIGFDPNYHQDLITKDSVSLEDLKKIISNVDIIKPSLDDSIRIFGPGFSIDKYMEMYQSLGPKLIIMTLGEDGLIASYKNEIIKLPSLAKEIIDVTGAGDAFWSGLYSGILNQESILNSIKIGLVCSAYNLKNIGAISNLPSIDEIKRILVYRS